MRTFNFKILVILAVLSVMFLAASNNILRAEDTVDPTGTLQSYLEMERDHLVALQSFVATIPFDTHPVYGTVNIDDMPVHPEGWSNDYVAELFPGEEVVSYETKDVTITSAALVAHQAPTGEKFHVWHDLVDEPGVLVTAKLMTNQVKTVLIRPGCGNPIWIDVNTWAFYVDGMPVSWFVMKFYLRLAGVEIYEY